MSETTTCDCKWCGTTTRMTGTKMCDGCWELDTRINRDPAIARRILEAAGDREKCADDRYSKRVRWLRDGYLGVTISDTEYAMHPAEASRLATMIEGLANG